MNNAYLSLGSNEGDRMLWLQKATDLLAADCGTILQQSSVYETAAWGITDQPSFLNVVIQMHTTLAATELLAAILNIEITLGRKREVKWGPRIIDIDILLFNTDVVNTPGLTIPHPYMQDRRFILVPLAEIAASYVHPVFHTDIKALLEACTDDLEVIRHSI